MASVLDEFGNLIEDRQDRRQGRRDYYGGLEDIGAEDVRGGRDLRTISKFFLGEALGSDRMVRRATRRLERRGIDPSKLDRSQFGENTEEDYIDWLAGQGLIEGKRARLLETKLTREKGKDRLDLLASESETEARDDIARGYQGLREHLAGILPGGVDPSSGALLALGSEYQQSREEDLSRSLRSIKSQNLAGKTVLDQTALREIGPLLENIGFTVDALEKLRDEEQKLAGIERATTYAGALFNPIRGFGSLVGGAVGGRGGAVAGGNAAFGGAAESLAMLQAIMGLVSGTGGGRPGQTAVPMPQSYGGSTEVMGDFPPLPYMA